MFEHFRVDKRRHRDDLMIPADIRYKTLREWDVPIREIQMAEKNCEETKRRRKHRDSWYTYQLVIQYLKRTLKRHL